LMSVKALNWVMHQVRTDGPSAQAVLFVIADVANAEGIARHTDPEDIATRSRQSRATIFRRLREMEHFGLLTWLAQGKQQYEFHLTLDREFDYDRKMVEAMRGTQGETLGEGSSDESPQVVQSQSETPQNEVVESHSETTSSLKESHSCDSTKSPLESKKDSPQKPPERSGGLSSEIPLGQESEASADPPGFAEWLEAFRAIYPRPSNHPVQVRALALAIGPDKRGLALRGAAGVRAFLDKNPKASIPEPRQFLRNEAWGDYLAHAPDASPQAAQGPQMVPEDSREGRALKILYRIGGVSGGVETREGTVYRMPKPLGPRELHCGAYPQWTPPILDDRYPLEKRWQTITDLQQIAAWREFVSNAIERWRPIEAPGGGIRVPQPWPPTLKESTTQDSQAPPDRIPGTLMTESDAAEFDKMGS
jgi:hypothetical protein